MVVREVKFAWGSALSGRRRTECIVLHHAAAKSASVEDIHRLHLSNGWAGIGYHYYVRKDGSVYRGRPENVVGAHAKGYNDASVGVCFEGNFEEEDMCSAQLAAGVELLADIRARLGALRLVEHREVCATACPGRKFPGVEINEKLNQRDAGLNVQLQFVDDSGATAAAAVAGTTDAAPSAWAREACEWAVERGIVLGDGCGNYGWHSNVTVEQMVVLLRRVMSDE